MPNYENGMTTRRAIVNAGRQLFYEKGYLETSYGDICAASYVNRSTIYYHFKTKEDLRYEVNWEYFISCKHLTEKYCPDSRYHCLLAMCIFWRLVHSDAKLRRFVLQCCRDFPVYTGKRDFSYFYYTCYEGMWGAFWDKRKIPQMAFISAYGYIMSCMRMLCEYPEKYDPTELHEHCILSSAAIWGIPRTEIESIRQAIRHYLTYIPEEEMAACVP